MQSKLQTLKNIKKRARQELTAKHDMSNKKYHVLQIDNILNGVKSRINTQFKEMLLYEETHDVFRKYYDQMHSYRKLERLYLYYKDFSKIYPNLDKIWASKYLHNNLFNKQVLINEMEEIEKNKLLDDKNTKIQKIFSIEEEIENEAMLFTTEFCEEYSLEIEHKDLDKSKTRDWKNQSVHSIINLDSRHNTSIDYLIDAITFAEKNCSSAFDWFEDKEKAKKVDKTKKYFSKFVNKNKVESSDDDSKEFKRRPVKRHSSKKLINEIKLSSKNLRYRFKFKNTEEFLKIQKDKNEFIQKKNQLYEQTMLRIREAQYIKQSFMKQNHIKVNRRNPMITSNNNFNLEYFKTMNSSINKSRSNSKEKIKKVVEKPSEKLIEKPLEKPLEKPEKIIPVIKNIRIRTNQKPIPTNSSNNLQTVSSHNYLALRPFKVEPKQIKSTNVSHKSTLVSPINSGSNSRVNITNRFTLDKPHLNCPISLEVSFNPNKNFVPVPQLRTIKSSNLNLSQTKTEMNKNKKVILSNRLKINKTENYFKINPNMKNDDIRKFLLK